MSSDAMNLEIDENQTAPGGRYGSVEINGIGAVSGDLFCDTLEVNGVARVSGKIAARGSAEINGVLKMERELSAGNTEINGSVQAGDLTCGDLEVGGELKCGALSAGKGEVSGVIKTEGAAEFTGPLEVSGALKVRGSLTAGNTEIDGSVSAEGGCRAGELTVAGNLRVSGPFAAGNTRADGNLLSENGAAELGDLTCGGSAHFEKTLSAARILLDGQLSAEENIEAESIECRGLICAKGQISADRVTVSGGISAEEIVGDRIEIGSAGEGDWRPIPQAREENASFLQRWFRRLRKSLPTENEEEGVARSARLIEATVVRLYNTDAETVNGQEVSIGPGCRIGKVDCSGNLEIDPRSFVGEFVTGTGGAE